METFHSGSFNVSYITKGKGDPVLFLHGFPDSSEVWKQQINAFAKAGYHCIAPDLRGYGNSSKPKDTAAYKLKEVAKDVTGLLRHLKIDAFFLIGHDWGAALAWHIASRIPERVKALAVLSTGHSLAFFPSGGIVQRQKSWYCLFFLHPGVEALLTADDWALWRTFMQHEPPKLVEAQIARLSQPDALSAGLGWYRANVTVPWFAMTKPPEVIKLPMPVLGLWSDGDPVLTEEQMKGSEQFVEEGQFSYKRIEGVGHWMQLQAAEEVSKTLLQFFKRHGNSKSSL